jgi:hypothetical protein
MVDLKTELGLRSEAEVAKLRGIQISRLRNERSRGEGPPFTKIGNAIFYPISELRDYMKKKTVTPQRAPTMIDGRARSRA